MSGDPRTPHDDAERDAWLREALRHAPDAQLGPPSALSDRILREAQAKARSATPPSRRRAAAPLRWWASLGRPAAGAAFASMMLAVAVGLLWWDRPMEDMGPRPSAPANVAEAPVPPAPQASSETAAVAPPAVAPVPAAPPAPAPDRRAKSEPERRRDIARLPAAEPALRRESPIAEAGKVIAQAPAPLAAAPATAAAPVDATHKAARAVEPSPPPPAAAVSRDAALDSALAAKSRTAGLASERAGFAPPQIALEGLRTAVTVQSAHWSWQRGAAEPRPVTDAVSAWLAELDTAAGGQWRRTPDTLALAAGQPADDELVLLHDGRITHRLRIGNDAVHWDMVGDEGRRPLQWHAPIDAPRSRALRESLSAATR
ncbi:MAG TPA: hypothetical protein VF169_00640 [Albitalea sp.]|uniref:hypothetical protein n=1 Tax=Piscinibacter sp. TaxID=1903157 RepID=UPI002ED3CCA3